jgi:peptidoglycan/xylan/chitin deacetylase (PgdA/CDA1 family)
LKRLLLIQPNKVFRKFYSKGTWQISTKEKEIYLTFDDGPVPGLTEWILDELKHFNAKATFFCVGQNIEKYPAIFRRILEEGHTAANHTFNHLKGFHHNLQEYIENVAKCELLTGNKLFRPPYGRMRKSQYKFLLKQNYKIVFWDVISYDYEKISPEYCFSIVKKRTKPGSIVLFHDNIKAEKNVSYALRHTLLHFSKLGYTFKALQS